MSIFSIYRYSSISHRVSLEHITTEYTQTSKSRSLFSLHRWSRSLLIFEAYHYLVYADYKNMKVYRCLQVYRNLVYTDKTDQYTWLHCLSSIYTDHYSICYIWLHSMYTSNYHCLSSIYTDHYRIYTDDYTVYHVYTRMTISISL